jgi:type 1 glutamine amidotransferase
MKVLVICDDYYHPAKVVREGLALMGDDPFQFDIIEDVGEWSAAKMAAYPVVLFAKSDNISAAQREPWVTDEVQEAFAAYVRGGGGLLAVHSGTASYTEKQVLRAVLGGVFTHHPKQCP